MSVSTNTTYRVYVEKLGAANPSEFIGDAGEVFYDPNSPTLKLSDGSTPGGITIAGGGGGGGESYWVSGVSGISTSSNVGIGTDDPQYKLHVIGDARITGILTVGNASVTIDGNNNTLGVGSSITIDGSSGVIYSSVFVGDGSGLVGIVTDAVGTEIYEDGAARGTATCMNFGNGFNVDPVSSSCANINIGLDGNSNFVVGGGSAVGYYNNILGFCAGAYNTFGYYNNFLGSCAGAYNTFGYYNNFFGWSAGKYNSTGSCNNFFGCYSGKYNTIGSNNIFMGGSSGYNNTIGYGNIFFGREAGYCNIYGTYNNFFGYCAGYYNTADNNIFFGYYSGKYNTIGNSNIFIGDGSGKANTTGSYNIFLGSYSGSSTTASNKIILGRGYLSYESFDSPDTTKDTQLAIGVRTDSNPANYWLVGNENFNVGIGTINPTSKLTVGGDVKVGFNTSQGVILTSPNGTQYRLVVNNSGALSTVAV